jgi:hypothetical protein
MGLEAYMKVKGVEVNTGGNDTLLVLGALGILGVALWKSGIFSLLKTTAGAAGGIVKDVVDLPQNLITIAGMIPQLPLAIVQNMSSPLTQQSIFAAALNGKIATFPGSASISLKVVHMIQSTYNRYSGVNASNWSLVARQHGAIFDSDGYIISDNGS